MYVHMCACMYVCMYAYVYTYVSTYSDRISTLVFMFMWSLLTSKRVFPVQPTANPKRISQCNLLLIQNMQAFPMRPS